MQLKTLNDDVKKQLLAAYEPVSDWQAVGPFCVDGRDGAVQFNGPEAEKHLFAQALGGSLNAALLSFLHGNFIGFEEARSEAFTVLQSAGMKCGVHRGSHAGGESSDCGFADNMPKIVRRLADKADEIKSLIEQAAPGVMDEAVWQQVVEACSTKQDPQLYPAGENMIQESVKENANLQTLEAEHAEAAALVNLKPETTFNTGKIVQDGLQAFNLDLWCVLRQAEVLNVEEKFATLATLGLYVATEMVLVEDKKQVRLPIVIHS